jgi:uncharacterized protein YndB with AHSA1/START domain
MAEREHSLVVSRVFRATPEQLYQAWTDLSLMRQWMGVRVDADVRVGGSYHREVDAGDAGIFVHVGDFEVLDPNRRIVQSFRLENPEGNPFVDEQIEILLKPVNVDETKLVLIDRWNGPDMSPEERQAADEAWGEWLQRIGKVIRLEQA